jgi:hypothetical protein
LVIDTTAIAPQAYIAISEATGIRNNGGMHILERVYLAKPDVPYDDLEITAPKAPTKPEHDPHFPSISRATL